MTTVLPYQPVRDGYTVTPGYSVVEARMEGGPSRRRQDSLLAPHTVSVNWILDHTQYTPFMGFFRSTLLDGTAPFLLDLPIELAEPTTHKCRLMGGMPKLTQKRGHAHYVSATLEVEHNYTFTGNTVYGTFLEGGQGINGPASPHPPLNAVFSPGDKVMIMGAFGTHSNGINELDLDGTYTVDTTVSTVSTHLRLSSPGSVNSDWTTLAGLIPLAFGSAVVSTFTRVPT